VNRQQIQGWILSRVATIVGVQKEEIDVREPLARYGIDSAQVLSLSGELERRLDRRLSPTLLFEYPSIDALAAYLAEGRSEQGGDAPLTPRAADEPIAIVGLACRLPGAPSAGAFWGVLRDGVDAISEVPPARWNADDFYDADPTAPGKASTRWGGFVEGVDGFDPHFFGISPREALEMDPQQRLLLQVAWEALEDAGIAASKLASKRVGVFVGISHGEYGGLAVGLGHIDALTAAGNALSIAANRISYAFDFRGPSLAVDTACSSSLVAVHLACRSLRSGESTVALAAGSNLLLSPALSVSFTKAGLMAPDGRCKAFDARANGYVRGEGVGVVVLKPLSAALADGDTVYAIIRGSAVTQDGKSNGLMAPNPQAQQAAVRQACADASVAPSSLQYVEAHGTGTLLGDPIELRALGAVLAVGRAADRPCIVGSVKTNVGHLEAAAGITSLIKMSLMMRHGLIPPSLHFETPNPDIPFEELRLRVPTRLEPWEPGEGVRLAGISSFGFGGTNAHVVLASPPTPVHTEATVVHGPFLLPISARSEPALRQLAQAYRDLLRGADAPTIADIAYSAAIRREHHAHRLALIAMTAPEAAQLLEEFLAGQLSRSLVVGDPKQRPAAGVTFAFAGQGTPWIGMGRELAAAFPVFRAALTRVDGELQRYAKWSVVAELAATTPRFNDTEVAQPAIFAIQIALVELLRSWGIAPHAVVGSSLGEVAAAHVAGRLSLADAARVVFHRARLMQRGAGQGAMATVGLSAEAAANAIAAHGPTLTIAAINGPRSTVIAGAPAALASLVARLESEGVFTRPFGVDYAFHTAQMDAFVPELVDALRGIEPLAGAVRMVSTVTGAPIEPRHLHAEYWARNMREPVAFHAAARRLVEDGHRMFVEIGPHPALGTFLEDTLREADASGVVCASLRREKPEVAALLGVVATLFAHGYTSDLAGLFPGARPGVPLPGHPWNNESYWPDARPLAAHDAREHALLGTHLRLATGAVTDAWQGTPSLDRVAYLSDHRVAGVAVVPAAAYFDTLLAAAAMLPGAPRGVENVDLHRKITIDGALPSFQTLAVRRDGRTALEIYTRSAAEEAWSLCASAIVEERASAAPPRRESLDDIRIRCFEPVPAAALYHGLAEHGLDYGPAFRGLAEVGRRANEAIGRVRLPDTLHADARSCAIHPALLDACLHVIAPAIVMGRVDHERPSVLIPTRAQSVRLLRRPTGSVWSHVSIRPEVTTPDVVHADVRLLDDDGELLAEIHGLELRRIALARPARRDDEVGTFLYETQWKPIPSDRPREAVRPGDRWLVFADAGGAGERLVQALEQRGAACLQVERIGARRSHDATELNPTSQDELRRYLRERLGPGQPAFRGIVHLWSLDAHAMDHTDLPALARAHDAGVASALALVQALAFSGAAEPPKLWIATRGAVPAGGRGGGLAQSPIWGLGKALAFEQPELACTLVDLDPSEAPTSAEQLLEVLLAGEAENQIALREGVRHVPRLVPAHLAPLRRAPLDAGATYLIAGGLGGLGPLVAEWLVGRGARNLVLLGRRAPTPEVAARLDSLRQLGARVLVEPLDIADPARVEALLRTVRATMPPLRGIVHAAAVLDDGALLDLSRERLLAVMSPKVLGAWTLHALTRTDPLDFFVLFSSAVSVLGSPGQTNYTVANTFLDALAHERRAAGLPAVSINWGPWADVGLAAETARRAEAESQLRAHLVKMILPEKGLELLERILHEATPQITVLPFDIRNVLQFYPEGAGIAFFSEVLRQELQALSAEPRVKRLYARPEISQEYVAPRDEVEEVIAGIWQRALTLDRVGVYDNFFELGGDSVFAGQIVSQMNKAFGVSVSLRDAFASVTVAHLASLVQEHLLAKLEGLSEEEAENVLQSRS
jgi:myxalamid-type polyketide synthase MxaE and MxaD